MKYVIFDFDGTIADTFPIVLDIAQDLTGLSLSKEEIERLRNMPIKAILKEYKIPYYKIPGFLVQGRKLLESQAEDLNMIQGLETVFKELTKQGYKLQIVSSNSAPIINKFLQRHKIDNYFSSVHGSVGLFSKAQALKKIIKKQKATIDDCIYIGDELRDVEAAHKIGLKVISVTWGFNGSMVLGSAKPNRVVTKPADLTKHISSLL